MDFNTSDTPCQQGFSSIVYPDINISHFDVNTCLFYSGLNQILMKMTRKRKRQLDDSTNLTPRKKMMLTKITSFEQNLDDLFYEWTSINVVLQSIRTSFASKGDLSEAHLQEVDRELGIAYDDLHAQIRQLERRIKRMRTDIKTQLYDQGVSENPKRL